MIPPKRSARIGQSFFKRNAALPVMIALLAGAAAQASASWYMHIERQRECDVEYSLMNPLRRCLEADTTPKKEYEEFEDTLQAWIADEQKAGRVDHVSVYFRDLGSGPWFGLNEEEEFSVASLFKVPIMMALLKHAESNPQILVQTLGYTGQTPGLENVTDADKTVLPGHYYSVDELLRRMIVYSDNISKELVKARLDAIDPAVDELHQTYKDLGLIGPDDTLSAKLTVKQYSSLFRILYNGFYLNKEMSQKALDLLSQAEFKDGLVAGVPTGVRIAHKFGIREDGQDKQLHDCGIVYDPLTPYLICIMTRSDSFQNNAMAIQNISRMVYDEVMERNRESMIKEGV